VRNAFNKTILDLTKKNDRIVLLTADMGYGQLETFAQMFPGRFYNVGVAEQNMTGIASGLAMEGNIVITYSIGNFPTLRTLEQIRNDVCYHNLNVKIVIIGGGLSYGVLGVSHHSTEDLAIMRALPNMVVVSPCDCYEAKAAAEAMIEYEGPVYYRCGYKGEKDIHQKPVDYKIGRSIKIRDGCDATIIFAGSIGYNVLLACDLLLKRGIKSSLISMHTLKPIDAGAISKAAEKTRTIITVEEHNILGGLGGAVAEVLAEICTERIKFKRIGIPDVYATEIGSRDWLLTKYCMSPLGIAETVTKVLES